MFDLEIGNVKLKDAKVNFIKAICENPTPAFKWKLDLFTLKGMCLTIQKSWTLKPNCSNF